MESHPRPRDGARSPNLTFVEPNGDQARGATGTTIGILGLGASGAHAARQLRDQPQIEVLAHDSDSERQREVVSALALNIRPSSGVLVDATVVILATPAGHHVEQATRLLRAGTSVISMSDAPQDIDGLLALGDVAREAGRTVLVGAGFAPGLTCLLARFAGDSLDTVTEIAVSKTGTGGPACARQHHLALKSDGRDWVEGEWTTRSGGSGRDLVWFPGVMGARDCYRGALPTPTLLQRRYPLAKRISARVSATRRDRLTSRLPMLRPPHRDGGPGAVRVEVRGHLDGAYVTRVYGVMDHPSVAAGTVAAVMALAVGRGELSPGCYGLSEIEDVTVFLRELHRRGIKPATFGSS